MAKDTVRYPDPVVAAIDEQVADGVFESKSEFYRFAAEYVLTLVTEEYEPESFAFEELRRELGVGTGGEGSGADPFFRTAAAVRQAALRGDAERAAATIDEQYAPADREALLLEELLAAYGARAERERPPPHVKPVGERPPTRRGEATDGGTPGGSGEDQTGSPTSR